MLAAQYGPCVFVALLRLVETAGGCVFWQAASFCFTVFVAAEKDKALPGWRGENTAFVRMCMTLLLLLLCSSLCWRQSLRPRRGLYYTLQCFFLYAVRRLLHLENVHKQDNTNGKGARNITLHASRSCHYAAPLRWARKNQSHGSCIGQATC